MLRNRPGTTPFLFSLLSLTLTGILIPLAAESSIPKNQLQDSLKKDLLARKSSSFDPLLNNWEKRYGTDAVEPLLRIAKDSKNTETDRYIALMGASKMGGASVTPKLLPLLKDRSWMIRSGTLRAFAVLQHRSPEIDQAVLSLLKDPALVVRSEAVDTVSKIRPEGAAAALVATLENGANYHAGKAQWVPQKALQTLATLNTREAREMAPRLRPLLFHAQDPALLKQTVDTLDALAGRPKNKTALSMRVESWKQQLSRSAKK